MMLELVNVNKYYTSNGTTNLGLRNVNLKVSKNEIVAIVGESGSGKSTLLNVLTKMDTFDDGEIYYKGNETSYFSIDDMDNFRKDKIGFIFQNYNIIESYTVLENVMLPLTLKGVSRKEAKVKALEYIKKVGLKDRVKHRGTKLSGGEKQRCVIARALASECEILACDEPTGNLDSKTGKEIIDLIKEIAQDKLVLIVTHNFDQVKDIATRKIKVHDGEIIEDQIITQVQDNEQNEELDLDYKPIKKTIDMNIAKNNILFTPKRTFFISIVFIVSCILCLFMYQSISNSNNDKKYNNNFVYRGTNEVIAYKNDNSEIDKSVLSKFDKYVINSFYETSNNLVYISGLGAAGYVAYPNNLHLDGGRSPENENECILLIPNNYYIKGKDYIDYNIKFDEYSRIKTKDTFKIVGYQERSDIRYPLLTGCQKLNNCAKAVQFVNQCQINAKSNKYNASIACYYNPNNAVTKYKLVSGYELKKSTIKLNGYEIIKEADYANFQSDTSLEEYNTLEFGTDLLDLLDAHIYELSIFGNKKEIKKELKKLNIDYMDVHSFTQETKLEHFINNLYNYGAILLSSLSLIIVYFISYIILAKIYNSKKKDYTILRTLGVTKKDMKHIVDYEVLIETFGSIIITLVAYIVLYIFQVKMFTSIYPFVIGIFVVVMSLFGYLLARRFNRRLFKFSVNATFKSKEAKQND